MSTCVAPLSETMGVEEHAEADRSLQDKPVDKQLSADHLSTCVALLSWISEFPAEYKYSLLRNQYLP